MPAFNPFLPADMAYLSEYIEAADALPVMVMPAGVDPLESMETGEAFAEAGAVYLLATRLDAARRVGGVHTDAKSRENGTGERKTEGGGESV